MGLINNDNYTAANGVQKIGTYIAFSNETLYVSQASSVPAMQVDPATPATEPMYSVRANYRVYWDKEARDSGKGFIDLQMVSTVIPLSQMSNNPYVILYDVLKSMYPNATDEFRAAAPAAPVADPVAPAADPAAPAAPSV